MDHFSSCGNSKLHLLSVLRGRPQASANIAGGQDHPDLSGTVRFYQTARGVIVCAELTGLPHSESPCLLCILQTARIYSDASGKIPGWRSAVGLYCKFNRYEV